MERATALGLRSVEGGLSVSHPVGEPGDGVAVAVACLDLEWRCGVVCADDPCAEVRVEGAPVFVIVLDQADFPCGGDYPAVHHRLCAAAADHRPAAEVS